MDPKIIISASRRTDLPAFYIDWLIKSFKQQSISITNPFNNKLYTVSLHPDHVHSIVLWSKNFTPFINKIHELNNYQLFFMFTINDCSELEPNIPSLQQRFEQLDYLKNKFGRERLFIRFDPIVLWEKNNEIKNNLSSFGLILKKISSIGINKLKISFMNTYYRKLSKRGFSFIDPPLEQKLVLVENMARLAQGYDVSLQFCCNEYLFKADYLLPAHIERSSCIDGHLMANIIGEPTILKKDTSQRKECHCTYSKDIGSYSQMCNHGCVYCYANPKSVPA